MKTEKEAELTLAEDKAKEFNRQMQDIRELNTKEIQKMKELKKKLEDSLTENKDLKAQVEGLQRDKDLILTESADLRSKLDGSLSENNKLTIELKKAKDTAEVPAIDAGRQEEVGELKRQLEDALRCKEESDLKAKEVFSKWENVLSENEELRTELEVIKDEEATLKTEKEAELTLAEDKAKDTTEAAVTNITRPIDDAIASDESTNLEVKLQIALTENEKLSTELKMLKDKAMEEVDADELKMEMSRLKYQVDTLRKQKTNESIRSDEIILDLHHEIDDLNCQLNENKSVIDGLRKDLQDAMDINEEEIHIVADENIESYEYVPHHDKDQNTFYTIFGGGKKMVATPKKLRPEEALKTVEKRLEVSEKDNIKLRKMLDVSRKALTRGQHTDQIDHSIISHSQLTPRGRNKVVIPVETPKDTSAPGIETKPGSESSAEESELKALKKKIVQMEAELDAAYEATAELVAEEQEMWKNEQIKVAELERQLDEAVSANNSAVGTPTRKAKDKDEESDEEGNNDKIHRDFSTNSIKDSPYESDVIRQERSPCSKSTYEAMTMTDVVMVTVATSCTDLPYLLHDGNDKKVDKEVSEENDTKELLKVAEYDNGKLTEEIQELEAQLESVKRDLITRNDTEEKLKIVEDRNEKLINEIRHLEAQLEASREEVLRSEDDRKRLRALKTVNTNLQESVEMLDKEKEDLIQKLSDLRNSSEQDMLVAQQRISYLEGLAKNAYDYTSTSTTPGSVWSGQKSSPYSGVSSPEKVEQHAEKLKSENCSSESFINACKVSSSKNDTHDTGGTDNEQKDKHKEVNSASKSSPQRAINSVEMESTLSTGSNIIASPSFSQSTTSSPMLSQVEGSLIFPEIDHSFSNTEHEYIAHILSIGLTASELPTTGSKKRPYPNTYVLVNSMAGDLCDKCFSSARSKTCQNSSTPTYPSLINIPVESKNSRLVFNLFKQCDDNSTFKKSDKKKLNDALIGQAVLNLNLHAEFYSTTTPSSIELRLGNQFLPIHATDGSVYPDVQTMSSISADGHEAKVKVTLKVPLPITENMCGWFWQVKKNFLFPPTWNRIWISANKSYILCYDTPYQQNLVLRISKSDINSVETQQYEREGESKDVFVFKCSKNDGLMISHGDETEKNHELWMKVLK